MKPRLLFLGLVFLLSSVTAKAQFTMEAELTEIEGSYMLNLFASGPQNLVVKVGYFTITIEKFRNETGGYDTTSTPLFSSDFLNDDTAPAIHGTGFEGYEFDPTYTVFDPQESYVCDLVLNISYPEGGSPNTFPFSSGVRQRLLSLKMEIPDGLESGSWSLILPNTRFNVLTSDIGDVTFDNLQSDYILRYDGSELTLDVPEPSQFALVGGLALLGFAGWRRSRK